MTFLEERNLEDVPTIPDYYKGKTIFITGGSGFMGKVLIEKLLHSCPQLDRIYLLMRNKKGVKPKERITSIYKSNCFERLRQERPGLFESKVFFIAGDVSEDGLGISEEDRTLLINRTHIIFNGAASVRFDDQLKVAVKLNLRGAIQMLELAKDVRNLETFLKYMLFAGHWLLIHTQKSFIHISTSYSNTNRDPIEEIMYPPLADWRDTLKICDEIDDRILEPLTAKYLGEMPNTYSFTKQLAENMLYEHRGKLPIVIVRPSVVISSVNEPVPGWIENFNGPIGILVARGKGILRTLYTKPNIGLDYVPVDVSIKGVIAASWIRGTKKLESTDDVAIYNSSSSNLFKITNSELETMAEQFVPHMPLKDTVWLYGKGMTTSLLFFNFQVWLYHLLPALFLDMLLWMLGKKTRLVKLQRRIYVTNLAFRYYLNQEWNFSNLNFIKLRSKIKEEDRKAFFYELENINKVDYFYGSYIGAKKYLLHESDDDLTQKKNKQHYEKLKLVNRIVKATFYGLIFYWLMKTDFMKAFFAISSEISCK